MYIYSSKNRIGRFLEKYKIDFYLKFITHQVLLSIVITINSYKGYKLVYNCRGWYKCRGLYKVNRRLFKQRDSKYNK